MKIVRRFETAFNKQDVDALVACFTEGATYTDTFFGAHTGHPALRAMFARMFREGRDYAWRMETIVEDARHAAAEWSFGYVVTDAGSLNGTYVNQARIDRAVLHHGDELQVGKFRLVLFERTDA